MTRTQLKNFFKTGLKPTQGQFASLIDSLFHRDEDELAISKVTGLSEVLGSKADEQATNDAIEAETQSRITGDEDLQMQIDELAGLGYTLPVATATVLGGVKQGSGVTIAEDGTISASGGGDFDLVAAIEAAPIYDDEAAAIAGAVVPYHLYKTSTGELRYKLPNPETPDPPTDGVVDDEEDTFTYTGGEA